MSPKTLKRISIIAAGIVVLAAIYIMVGGLGLVPEYDFGAGAYYYADIPDYPDVIHDEAYSTSVPIWVHILIFLAWGALMWWLWKKVDK